MATQIVRMQQRRDSTVDWEANDPVLLPGEIGYDTTTDQIKIGDGTSTWSELLYANLTVDDISSAVADTITEPGPAKDALSASIDAVGRTVFVPLAKTDNTTVPAFYTLRTVKAARSTVYRESQARGVSTYGPTVNFENTTWGWGFNMTPAYTKEIPTEPMWRMGMESTWLNPSNGEKTAEWHLGYIDPASAGSEIRPVSYAVLQGGDGGLGSPTASMCVSEVFGGFSMYTPAGLELASLGSAGWYFRRTMNIARGSGAASRITLGDALNDAYLVMNPKKATNVAAIQWLSDGNENWLIYDQGNTTTLALRDTQNNRQHTDFVKGTTNDLARLDVSAQIRAFGNEHQFGSATNKAHLGGLGTGDIWLDAQGSNTNIALNLRSKGSSFIISQTRHQFSSGIGVFGATPPSSRPTVSGSRGGNVALASLLSTFANAGHFTDATTA